MVDWSKLPHDLVVEIAKRVAYIDDFLVFGAVCKSWQQAADKENFNSLSQFSQVPWLLVGTPKGISSHTLFNLSKGASHHISIPEIHEEVCIASRGWLVIISRDYNLSLLHPLSRTRIRLPRLRSNISNERGTLNDKRHLFVQKAAISSKPSQKGDFSVVVINQMFQRLAYLGPGGETWIKIHNPRPGADYCDVIYYNNQFYVVDGNGRIMVCDVRGSKQVVTQVVARLPIAFRKGVNTEHSYLVESEGKLFMVARTVPVESGFQVFHVDFNNGSVRWKKVKNLGDMALFLGFNTSFSTKACLSSGCKPNCIYVTDRMWYSCCVREGQKKGIYSVVDGRMKPYNGHDNYAGTSVFAPLWVTLDF